MLQGALTVQHDGTLTIQQPPAEDTAALEAALACFADLVCPTANQRVYRLTAASIWRARRAGLALEEMLQTLATSSAVELPPTVCAEITRWSHQIDRLSLEADHGRLVLRSTHPLALTAVQRHRTLGTFITRQLDAVTVALRPDTYPEVVQTFDACGYPVLPHAWRGCAGCRGGVRRPPRPGGDARTGYSPPPGSAGCIRSGPLRRGPRHHTPRRPAWPTRSWKTG